MSLSDDQLGRVAYEEFQRQIGPHDPARATWDDLPKINGKVGGFTQRRWINVAKAVVATMTAPIVVKETVVKVTVVKETLP